MALADFDGNERYLRLITSQHRTRPKLMAMLGMYLEKLQDIYDVILQLDDAFDVDRAVGVQLDMTGESVGAYRTLTFNPVYADSKLDDESYRKYIQARITMNQWDGTMLGLQELWEEMFGEYRIRILDHQNMSITAEFHGVTDLFEAELISNGYYAPKGEGVRVVYIFIMESTVQGQLWTGGACMDEAIYDYLDESSIIPSEQSVQLYAAGAVVNETITDYLEGVL